MSIKWPSAIIKFMDHFMCGLISNVVIRKSKEYDVVCDTECPVAFINNNIKTQNSPFPFLLLLFSEMNLLTHAWVWTKKTSTIKWAW